MFRLALSSLRAHRRRFVSTLLAVVLGISFLCGTLVLADTLQQSFQNVLSTGLGSVDAYVRHTQPAGDRGRNDGGPGSLFGQQRIDAALVEQIRAVPGVASAEGGLIANGIRMIGKDGKMLGASGPGGGGGGRGLLNRGQSWREDAKLNPYRLVAGVAPAKDNEVVIDRASSKQTGLGVGDPITILVPDPVVFRISGVATYGTEDSRLGGNDVLFTLNEAQTLMGIPGKVDGIQVRAEAGISQADLVARLKPLLSPETEAITGEDLTVQTQDSFQQRISAFTSILSGFAWVAVIVGAFVIYNTFAIVVAQRTREIGLLRALGAGRRQVLLSVVVEAVLVGAIASAAGVGGGLLMGALLRRGLRSAGMRFPPGGLVLTNSTALMGMVVGTVITLLAALAPALRAARVAPMQALREAALDASSQSKSRAAIGTLLTGAGLGLVAKGVVDKASSRIGFGAGLALIGLILLGPVLASPISRVLGWPLQRFRGTSGALARQNAVRNPRRTAGTATALLIGVAVVTFFGVIASSLRATTTDQIERSFVGDMAVRSLGGRNGGLAPSVAQTIAGLPDVAAASPLRTSNLSVNGLRATVMATDTTALITVLKLDMVSGSLGTLTGDAVGVADAWATEQGVNVGDALTVISADTGEHQVTVAARFLSTDVIDADVIMPIALDNVLTLKPRDRQILIKLRPGVPFEQGRAAVEAVLADNPAATVQDQNDLKQAYTSRINSLLAVIFGMLALAIVIALIGISNTLQLSVHERTREIGLLRAIGAGRPQIRSMVRWESVIIALIGTLGGTTIGAAFGWAIIHGLGRDNNLLFSIPLRQTLLVILIGAIAGIVASLRPARTAAKLDILQAIASE